MSGRIVRRADPSATGRDEGAAVGDAVGLAREVAGGAVQVLSG
jgi:hypothetical protein